jgi:hypothetical protein
MDQWRAGANRVRGADYRRRHVVFDRDQLSRIARERLRCGWSTRFAALWQPTPLPVAELIERQTGRPLNAPHRQKFKPDQQFGRFSGEPHSDNRCDRST